MQLVTEVVEVKARGLWDPDNEQYGEFVVLQAEGEDRARKWSLDKSLNGEIKVGMKARFKIANRMEPKALEGRNGPYVRHFEKNKVVGVAA